jgi:hypothetical protein
MATIVDTGDSAYCYGLLLSNAQSSMTPLCRAQRLLTKSLCERLKRNNGLVRGDFVASLEHVQERELASSLECAVLYAIDGVRHQRVRVELGRLGEPNLRDDGLHAGGVANPVCVVKKRR